MNHNNEKPLENLQGENLAPTKDVSNPIEKEATPLVPEAGGSDMPPAPFTPPTETPQGAPTSSFQPSTPEEEHTTQPQAPALSTPVQAPEGVPVFQGLEGENLTPTGHVGNVAQDTHPLLMLDGVSKLYGQKPAVSNVYLNVYPGRIIGLLGPNGSGKTTIIKMISGLLHPTTGNIYIDGHKPGPISKAIVSYLPEQTYIEPSMKVEAAVKLFSDFYADFDPIRALEMLHHLGVDPKAQMKTLSKGNKEKVQLILVMSRQARLYLLDEPIGGVDPAARDYILHTILGNYSPQSTVVLSTHLIHDIEQVLDDVIFIDQGQIVLTSSVDEIRSQHGKSVDELFREVYKC